jgi:protein-tyrosine phosphatase
MPGIKLPPLWIVIIAVMNYNRITEHLYVGGRLKPYDWETLAKLGITVNVSLQAEEQDQFLGVRPEVSLWLPTQDFVGPGVDMLQIAVPFVQAMIREGRRVYVHCYAGVGRSPTVAAACLYASGMSLEAALALIKARRPLTSINDGQRQQLHEFVAGWPRQGSQ